MRLLLALPLLVLPASAQPVVFQAHNGPAAAENSHDAVVVRAELVSAEHESSIETAKNMWEIAAAPTTLQEPPAEPEAPEAPPTAESAPEPEPEPAPELRGDEHRTAPRVVYAPTPETAVVIRSELPPDQRRYSKGHYKRAAERCSKRATDYARRRCLERVAAE